MSGQTGKAMTAGELRERLAELHARRGEEVQMAREIREAHGVLDSRYAERWAAVQDLTERICAAEGELKKIESSEVLELGRAGEEGVARAAAAANAAVCWRLSDPGDRVSALIAAAVEVGGLHGFVNTLRLTTPLTGMRLLVRTACEVGPDIEVTGGEFKPEVNHG